MERIIDPSLDQVLASSMSLFRGAPGWLWYRHHVRADELRSCGGYVAGDI